MGNKEWDEGKVFCCECKYYNNTFLVAQCNLTRFLKKPSGYYVNRGEDFGITPCIKKNPDGECGDYEQK